MDGVLESRHQAKRSNFRPWERSEKFPQYKIFLFQLLPALTEHLVNAGMNTSRERRVPLNFSGRVGIWMDQELIN